MALFPVSNGVVNFDDSPISASDTFAAGMRFTQAGAVRTTLAAGTYFNQGVPMAADGSVSIVDASAGLPADVLWLSGLPLSGNKLCVSNKSVSVVSSGLPYDAAGAVVRSFSPYALFLSGAEGVWYDPSDSSTLFSDTAGTTPCAAPGAGSIVNVGRMLDKSGRGNHAISYNSTTARPELSARVNLLTFSEQFDNAAWSKTSINTTGTPPWVNVAVAPDGTTTADKLIANTSNTDHVLGQTSISITSGTTYTLSAFFKGDASNRWVQLGASSGAFGSNVWANFDVFTGAVGFKGSLATASIVPFGNGWFKCIVTATANVTTTGGLVIFLLDNTDTNTRSPVFIGGNTDGVLAWGADLRPANIGANVPVYQRIANQYTYDTVGFPRYLRFDGVDDGMSTPANLNLSATDKATVFAGVRKLSDAASAVIVELSSNFNLAVGGFLVNYTSAGVKTEAALRGNVGYSTAEFTDSAAPISEVLSSLMDMSLSTNELVFINKNGVAQTLTRLFNANNTGNFGSFQLNIGVRSAAATPSLFLNGYIYSLIVVGAAATAAQISSTESWIAGKEGITL